jgi:drug/metabolite transporter (DMT)-like permease
MHRYIPVLAKNAGYDRITEKIVIHHPRKYGKTKYGIDRYIKGFLDLITLWFIHKFGKRPMHFFGLIGTVMLIIGFIFSVYLGIDKLFIEKSGRLISERPEFYIALTTMIMGSQFFLAGFLGEIILRNRKIKKQYIISEEINE